MNHTFFPSSTDKSKCKDCSRTIFDHRCTVCGSRSLCDEYMTVFMCESCQSKERALQEESTNGAEQRVNDERVRANEVVKQYGDYFNARVTPIVQVKQIYEIQNKPFNEFHEEIKQQIEHFARVLFEQNITTTEDTVSKLLIEFRAEIRTKLKEGDINYQPPIKAPKVSTTKVLGKAKSPIEKMAELLVGKAASEGKIMTIAEAMRKIQHELGMTK